jgi:hypothetical protein
VQPQQSSHSSYERKKEASEKRQRDDDPIQEQIAKRRRSAQSYPFSRNENRRARPEPASEEVSDRRRWCVRRTDELSAFFLLARNSQKAKLKIKFAKIKFFNFKKKNSIVTEKTKFKEKSPNFYTWFK